MAADTGRIRVGRTSLGVALAAALQLPVVATHAVQFLDPDDYRAHEARVCIAEGEILANPRRPRRFTEEQYFRTQAEMQALFADMPQALDGARALGERLEFTLEDLGYQFPRYPVPAGETITAPTGGLGLVKPTPFFASRRAMAMKE